MRLKRGGEKTLRNSEVYEVLNDLGLDEEEIRSVNRRNKLLNETIVEEVNEIVDFFSIKCELKKEDIARVVIRNPLILNESLDRINTLSEIYNKIGFSGDEYKRYIVNFDKAFSLNPRVVIENVNKMLSEGKGLEDVRKDMIENASKLF